MGLGASTSSCARREPRCLGREGGLLPGADFSLAIIPAGARDGAGSRAAHQDLPLAGASGGGGGYFATLPAREGGVLPALAVPSHPSATSVSHQFPGRDL